MALPVEISNRYILISRNKDVFKKPKKEKLCISFQGIKLSMDFKSGVESYELDNILNQPNKEWILQKNYKILHVPNQMKSLRHHKSFHC